MSGGGEDESIDVVLLEILYFFLLSEDGAGVFDLANTDDVRFSEQTLTLCQTGDSVD